LAVQLAWSLSWLHASFGVHTPEGQVVPAGQATPSVCHAQLDAVSAAQLGWSVCAAQGDDAR